MNHFDVPGIGTLDTSLRRHWFGRLASAVSGVLLGILTGYLIGHGYFVGYVVPLMGALIVLLVGRLWPEAETRGRPS